MNRAPVEWTLALLAAGALSCARSRSRPQSDAAPASATSIVAKATSSGAPRAAGTTAPSAGRQAENATPTRLSSSHRLCVGGAHTCFVDAKHSLWCWGGNYYGEVGNGTHGFGGRMEQANLLHWNVKSPTRVAPLEGKVRAVGCGLQSTCALTLDGSVYCWGNDENPKRLEPLADVPVLRELGGKAIGVALEASHTCAMRDDGGISCWGTNYEGQLGAEGPPQRQRGYAPATRMNRLGQGIVDVAVSEGGTCVLKSDATLWCWGRNSEGELGDGSYEKRLEPVRVGAPEKWLGVAAGKRHVCAVATDGRLWCWGRNYEGQLGNGQVPKTKPLNYATPMVVPKQFEGIRALDLGNSETLVVDGSGKLFAFGDLSWAVRGVSSDPRSTPFEIALPKPVVEVRANEAHRCALLTDDSVWCWGNAENFQLGNAQDKGSKEPVRVQFPSP